MRPDKDTYYLNISKAVSERSTCIRAHCGAIIVKDDVVLSTGYNGNPRNNINCCDIGKCARESFQPNEGRNLCNASHGEMSALINHNRSGGAAVLGSTLYVYFKRLDDHKNIYDKPCNSCMIHILNSGIEKIVNLNIDKYGEYLDITTIKNGITETVHGIL